MENTEEFDSEFYQANPDVLASQAYMRSNFDKISKHQDLEPEYLYKINVAHTREKNHGVEGKNSEILKKENQKFVNLALNDITGQMERIEERKNEMQLKMERMEQSQISEDEVQDIRQKLDEKNIQYSEQMLRQMTRKEYEELIDMIQKKHREQISEQILSDIEKDYVTYIRYNQRGVVMSCQHMSLQIKRFQQKLKMPQVLDLKPTKNYVNRTMVIDIEGTIVARVDDSKIAFCKTLTNFESDFILVSDHLLFKIRPYALEFLMAANSFYEIIAFSFLPLETIEKILSHIEREIHDQDIHQNEKPNEFMRVQKSPIQKTYFRYVIPETHFVRYGEYSLQNFNSLTQSRDKQNIVLLSSNPMRIVAAMNQDIPAVPIVGYDCSATIDYQLILAENYILLNRDYTLKIQRDFRFLQLD